MNNVVIRTVMSVALLSVFATSACTSSEPTGDDQDFWSVLAFPMVPVEVYSSVGEMGSASDLVVVGTVGEVEVGREWGDPREPDNNLVASLLLHINVSEVLRGKMPDEDIDVVTWEYTFMQYNVLQLSQRLQTRGIVEDRTGLVRPFPKGRVILFLRERSDRGSEIRTLPGANFVGGVSYRLVTPGGIAMEGDSTAIAPMAGATIALDAEGRPHEVELPEQQLAEEIATSSFEELLGLIRSIDG
ncbi:MAG: hypothetical protein KJ698_00075 [Actinobacteria bacterium]|nr:hypothetical protein [Actinomycetota bacterium]MBU1493515.1 hypothetical protein [Actinomycetota bacterium]